MPLQRRPWRLALLVWLGGTLAGPSASAAGPEFNRDVRGILSNHCYQCHGPDANQRQADLRLDTPEGATAVVEGRQAIKPGDLNASELIKRITSNDPDLKMPPADLGKPLSNEQVATLKEWVASGAGFEKHWSLIPPKAREPGPTTHAKWARNQIDKFVLASLEKDGVAPAVEADRRTLVRRLSFDLLGLPPSHADVEAFAADGSDAAYEKLVDKLLADPHFGERMATFWLDLVRFADTAGYHSDNERQLSAFRDWIIAAFNDNMPFDEFTVEQVAGDLLPNAGVSQRIASGYNRVLMTTEEGGAQAKEYTAKYMADRVRNISTVWMAATIGCSECHDHKFDPYSTKDFYRLGAFFADVQEVAVGRQPQNLQLPTPEQSKRLAELQSEQATLQAQLDKPGDEVLAAQAKWEETARSEKTGWTTLKPDSAVSKEGATLDIRDNGVIVASGANPDKDVYTIVVTTKQQGITGLRLEVLPDKAFRAKGPGRASNGNFVLNELEIFAQGAKTEGEPARVKTNHASADHSQQNGYPVEGIVDDNPATGWAILPETGKAHEAVIELAEDVGTPAAEGAEAETKLTLKLHYNYGSGHAIGKLRLSVTTAPRPLRAGESLPGEISTILAVEPSARNDEQKQKLAAYYRGIAPELASIRNRIEQLKKDEKALVDSIDTTLVAMAAAPRTVRVLPRGNWLDDSGEVVAPGTPEVFGSLNLPEGQRATRLDLARWLASSNNPMTARVFVNRLWRIAFGYGLARTLDDFGAQGTWPTHPELLDWLAVDFTTNGWDVKRAIKQMVMSSAYRMSSQTTPDVIQKDPYNRLLARQWRYRLDAEFVRDNALAISGLLSPKIGGKSAKPYQPAGYWQFLNFPRREWEASTGDEQYRRGLYTFWQRSFLHPSLLAFDASSREECVVERNRSNTPLQALVLLNDPTYVEAARAFAERTLRESGAAPEARIAFAFRAALQRDASPEETRILAALAASHHEQYNADSAAADGLLKVGQRPTPDDLDKSELAAWTDVCRAVLNLHETITRP